MRENLHRMSNRLPHGRLEMRSNRPLPEKLREAWRKMRDRSTGVPFRLRLEWPTVRRHRDRVLLWLHLLAQQRAVHPRIRHLPAR